MALVVLKSQNFVILSYYKRASKSSWLHSFMNAVHMYQSHIYFVHVFVMLDLWVKVLLVRLSLKFDLVASWGCRIFKISMVYKHLNLATKWLLEVLARLKACFYVILFTKIFLSTKIYLFANKLRKNYHD